jgi:hypothetical protein
VDPALGPLSFHYTPVWAADPEPWSLGSLASKDYRLDNYHCHWGSSEHAVEGETFTLAFHSSLQLNCSAGRKATMEAGRASADH